MSTAALRPKQRLLDRPPTERERVASAIARRLDGPVTALGVVFALVVLAQVTTDAGGVVGRTLEVASWALWALFVAEFVVRMVVAPSTAGFLRRNWWQALFLVVPFLRFLRVIRVIRAGRALRVARVVSSAVRSTRSARRALSDRLAWLAALTLIVVLASAQILYELEDVGDYGDALFAAALATLSGEPYQASTGAGRALLVILAVFSLVIVASLAGTVGAYFVERERRDSDGSTPAPPAVTES